jgi:hypothetical protein
MDPQYQQQPGYAPPKRTNGMAITALVIGILGVFVFQFVFGPLAIIFGGLGMGFANKNNGSGKGLAIAGLILGIVDLLLFAVVMLLFMGARGRF